MSSERRAFIVVDLGFGDSGKGTVTDFLARRGASWVVRFNGGAQAGHNVVTPDGRHHTFAQFGSGSFVPGVRTHLSRFMVVHPTALLVEARHLAQVGVPDALERLTMSREALVITPYHQAVNRLREWARADAPVGTCGVGFGEAVSDALAHPELTIRVGDLLDRTMLARMLERVREAKRDEAYSLARHLPHPRAALAETTVFEDASFIETWIEAVEPLRERGLVVEDGFLRHVLASPGSVVFEGAQGVLLDEWRGFHPHTTWSTCTFANALELLDEHGYRGEVIRLGVVRAYLTRHGGGPFPTEDDSLQASHPEPHNAPGGWQGAFRVGAPDALLLRYAVECCGGLDALAVTHLDRLPARGSSRIADGYRFAGSADPTLFDVDPQDPSRAVGLKLGGPRDLEHQARLTEALRCARPESRETASLVNDLSRLAGAPIALESWGPDASSKRWLASHIPLELPEVDAAPQSQRPVATTQVSPPQSVFDAHGLAVLQS